MSPRSLQRLHAQLSALGIPIHLATLKRWSTRFRWQARVAAIDLAATQRGDPDAVAARLAMDERHAQLARGLLSAGGSALQRLLSDDPRLRQLKPGDIARLLDLGLRAEREATQAAGDRRSIAIEVWNGVTIAVEALFTRCNTEADAAARAQGFAAGLDVLVDDYLAAVAGES